MSVYEPIFDGTAPARALKEHLLQSSEDIYWAFFIENVEIAEKKKLSSTRFNRIYRRYKPVSELILSEVNPYDISKSVRELKALRKMVARDTTKIVEEILAPTIDGEATTTFLGKQVPRFASEKSKETTILYLNVVTAASATRNLPYGDKPLHLLVEEQNKIFSEDLSSIVVGDGNGVPKPSHFDALVHATESHLVNLLSRKRNSSTAPLEAKTSAVLESGFETGRMGQQEADLKEFLKAGSNDQDARLVLEYAIHAKIVDDRLDRFTSGQTIGSIFISTHPTRQFGLVSTQSMVFLGAIYVGLKKGELSLVPIYADQSEQPAWFKVPAPGDPIYYPTSSARRPSVVRYQFDFSGFSRVFRGSIIVELANKYRTVSTLPGRYVTIGSYLASSFRSILLRGEEYQEGYKIDEDMEDLLKRLNRVDHAGEVSEPAVSAAVRSLLKAGETDIRLKVTDFSSATEYISWNATRAIVRALERVAIKLPSEPLIWSIAEFLSSIASEFRIEYREHGRVFTSYGAKCGLLMGSPMTKEVLHLLSDICSATTNQLSNRCRLILGDDLFTLITKDFYDNVKVAALQTNKEKESVGMVVVLTDRAVCMWKKNDSTIELLGSSLKPPKNLSPVKKFTKGQVIVPNACKMPIFIASLCDEDGESIIFPRTLEALKRSITGSPALDYRYRCDPMAAAPFVFGGHQLMTRDNVARFAAVRDAEVLCSIALSAKLGSKVKLHLFPLKKKFDERTYVTPSFIQEYMKENEFASYKLFKRTENVRYREKVAEISQFLFENGANIYRPKLRLMADEISDILTDKDVVSRSLDNVAEDSFEILRYGEESPTKVIDVAFAEKFKTGFVTSDHARRIGGHMDTNSLLQDVNAFVCLTLWRGMYDV